MAMKLYNGNVYIPDTEPTGAAGVAIVDSLKNLSHNLMKHDKDGCGVNLGFSGTCLRRAWINACGNTTFAEIELPIVGAGGTMYVEVTWVIDRYMFHKFYLTLSLNYCTASVYNLGADMITNACCSSFRDKVTCSYEILTNSSKLSLHFANTGNGGEATIKTDWIFRQ
ncbi:MAG: hypothetical protein Q4D62_14000 [Planctomycetia bacterium]|nr:hypothetical protein [Planctomycetia bacterium]